MQLPRFDMGDSEGGTIMRRGVPAMYLGGRLVTTVFDLLMVRYGVRRAELPGDCAQSYSDASQPCTPA